jgi:acyl-CoA reductase-like NAD-dependent aldehyde dehydrogenase
MRAMVFERTGGPEVLHWVERLKPEAAPGTVHLPLGGFKQSGIGRSPIDQYTETKSVVLPGL